jgi:metal-responsive CopG/Arc/MetJ family transcriptional regulator
LNKKEGNKKDQVARISISLSPTLLDQFDKSMNNAGFSDRSKAIQKALYEFINNNEWEQKEVQEGSALVVYTIIISSVR